MCTSHVNTVALIPNGNKVSACLLLVPALVDMRCLSVRMEKSSTKAASKQRVWPWWSGEEKDGAGVVGFVGSGCLIFALCGVLKSDNYNIIITLSKSGAWYIKSLTFLKLKEQSTTWSESKGGGRGRGGEGGGIAQCIAAAKHYVLRTPMKLCRTACSDYIQTVTMQHKAVAGVSANAAGVR